MHALGFPTGGASAGRIRIQTGCRLLIASLGEMFLGGEWLTCGVCSSGMRGYLPALLLLQCLNLLAEDLCAAATLPQGGPPV